MRKSLLALLVAIVVALLTQGPARGQGVVFANSDPVVTIHSTFAGQTITLFGNIEPGRGDVPEMGPYEAVILVRGPATDLIVREKERQFGIMLNADQAVYRRLPGYYAVLSSRPVRDAASDATRQDPLLSLRRLAEISRVEGSSAFDPELMRLMTQSNSFLTADRGVNFLSPTTFSARIHLPSSVPNGPFVARVLVLANGEIVGSSTTGFLVRTEGFERFVARTASSQPLIYGLAAVIIAIATGWMGGVLFRR
ncbi:TIGR02186 family protein [Pelagibacterium sp.]|uniref:TIGR02186 family protein n=1 Tax=Pelagibacterium sp. TaxID=1967288 RepID=UPI003BAAC778